MDTTIRPLPRASAALALLLIAGALAACDGDSDPSDAAMRDASDARAGAAADAAAPARDADLPDAATVPAPDAGEPEPCDRLDAPFDRTGDGGLIVARFVSIEPKLEYKGYYDWTLELRDRSGADIADAELAAEAEMPAHGHGTTPIELRHEPGSARYELREVNLFMAGKWEVTVTVRSSLGRDTLMFRACPRDPPDAGDADGAGPHSGH